ncbi:ATP-dependent Clp protease proteolytic subunit [uncultured Propionibacterium sp.]|uniref:SDH family Clp fold serine proteinase n=1 Tax=uncultured Propionibacterium sp. TaxID=218066 RepID=UPI00293004C0|nr:ATP-dependent Clp protease proteolytic subunit [uncultured Propionibacterium sp.]
MPDHTPLFRAEHSDRYERQELICEYQKLTGAGLIVVVDQITPTNMTVLEELLFDCDPAKDLHLLLSSPGGDGETALRMVRSLQQRCRELTVIVPDMAKSAATIVCLGAHHILMGPGGDLGPIDPQMLFLGGDGKRTAAASAKEIVAAVAEAEERIKVNPDSFTLFASLLSDVNMLMVEQAKAALSRSEALMQEALRAQGREEEEVEALASKLKEPLIDAPSSHSAVISVDHAVDYGLPAERADVASEQWQLIWRLWTRYFAMGCWPMGERAIYEGARASHAG